MSEVKRFEMEKEYSLDINIVPTEYPDGIFVHYDDYAALQEQLTQRDAQIAALTAESLSLKAINNDRRVFIMNGVQLGYIKVPTVETDPALETIRIAVSPQELTPATDAAANALRAEGVEMFGQWQRELAIKATGEVRCAYVGSVKDAITFANQLREGK